jgi:hypothetical protein
MSEHGLVLDLSLLVPGEAQLAGWSVVHKRWQYAHPPGLPEQWMFRSGWWLFHGPTLIDKTAGSLVPAMPQAMAFTPDGRPLQAEATTAENTRLIAGMIREHLGPLVAAMFEAEAEKAWRHGYGL